MLCTPFRTTHYAYDKYIFLNKINTYRKASNVYHTTHIYDVKDVLRITVRPAFIQLHVIVCMVTVYAGILYTQGYTVK